MADKKVSQLTALTAVDAAAADVLPVVDTSATTTKKISLSDVAEFVVGSGTFTSALGTPIDESLIDAKGDLIVGSAADTAVRVAVGSNNQVLMADSAQTAGVKWATVDALPSQTSNSGKYLTTNGTTASWATVNTTPVWDDDQNILANTVFN
jgi:hypothetical protein